jgi:hypothetical protein
VCEPERPIDFKATNVCQGQAGGKEQPTVIATILRNYSGKYRLYPGIVPIHGGTSALQLTNPLTLLGCRSMKDELPINRRTLLGISLQGSILASLVPSCAMTALSSSAVPTGQLGAITGNDLGEMAKWTKWLGRTQDHDLIYFNQNSWPELEASIPFIVGVGKQILAAGRKVHWSVPLGGSSSYEEVRDGTKDWLYTSMAHQILNAYRLDEARICVRLPWEFNGDFQTMRAKSKAGAWDGRLYRQTYRRIAEIFKEASAQFYFDWCPNIGTLQLKPELAYPGDDVVDVISVDVYYRKQYDDTGLNDAGSGIFNYRKTQANGLDWLDDFAGSHGKLIGLSEWGVDDNSATAFMGKMIEWIKNLGPRLSHHNYWDRAEVIDCRISNGNLPAIGSLYRQAFG